MTATYKKALEGNIWKATLFMIANKRIYVAMLGAFYLTIPNVTAETIGIILLTGSLAGFLFEIPSGYLADKVGHKKTLVLSRVLLLLSTLFFLFADSILWLLLGSTFLSLGLAFLSGTLGAFMHETLRGLGREDGYTKLMGKMSSIGFAVPIIFIVLVPFLISIDFRAPFIAGTVFDIIGLVVATSLVAPRVPQESVDEIRATNFVQVLKEGYGLGYFKYAIFGGILSGIIFGFGGFRAPYQVLLDIPVVYYGVLFGLGRVIASTMLAFSGRIKKYFTYSSLLRFKLIFFALLFLILALVDEPWVVVTIFIIGIGFHWGISQVTGGFSMEILANSKFKATLSSVKSQIGNLFGAVWGFGLGYIIEKTSYQEGFMYLLISTLITLGPMYLFIRMRERVAEDRTLA